MLPALEGLRVLEVGGNIVAHYAGKLLAELGADVLKVEPPEGDPTRRRGPYVRDTPHQEGSSLFLYLNTNKRGLTLDRGTPTGGEILERLARGADVVVWGDAVDAGDAAYRAIGDDWRGVWLLVSPFGATGPHAHWKAHGVNVYHAGGEGALIPGGIGWLAYPDREPLKGPGYAGEYSAGVVAAAGALVGLQLRGAEDASLLIDLSVQEALFQLMRPEVALYADEGIISDRSTREHGLAGILPAQDGWVELMPLQERMWENLVALMGNPDWAMREEFRDPGQRRRGEVSAEGNERLGEWTAQHPKRWLYEEAQRHGIAIGEVLSVAEALESPQMAARQFFVEIDHPHAGPLKYPSLPFRTGPAPEQSRQRPAPLLGQHNVPVLVDELGFSRREVVALYEARII